MPTLSPACRRLRQQRAGLGAPGLKWCGSERRRLRPCVGPWWRQRRAPVAGPCPKACAGRYTPRRLLPCARRPGPAPLCSGNERWSGVACSSPGVPNRRRRPWRSPDSIVFLSYWIRVLPQLQEKPLHSNLEKW